MIVNYNGLDRRTYARTKCVGVRNGTPPNTHARKSWLAMLLLFLSLGISQTTTAQSIANYAFSTATNGSLEDLTTGATSIMTGNNDTAATTVQAIGFDFWFMGVKYTHFSANSNGQFKLHTSSGDSAIGGGSITGYSAGVNNFAAFSGDNEVNNGMRMKVVGTAPNRKLVIEWNQFYIGWTPNLTNAGNMQAWLNEGTGVVTYVYGAIYNANNAAQSRAIYISSSNTVTTAGHVVIGASPTFVGSTSPATTSFVAGSGTATGSPLAENIGSLTDGSRRVFTFTPVSGTIANPGALSFTGVTGSNTTVNWTDDSNAETYFVVTRATDAAFTQNVVVSNLPSTTFTGTGTTYSSPQTGLAIGTTYYYKVQANSETGFSGETSGSQVTNAGIISGVKTVGTGGDYANLTTAFSDINSNGLSGNVELQLIAGYPASPETYPIAASTVAASSSFSVKVYPTVSGLSITSNNATGTLNLNGSSNLTFDGRVNQTGSRDLVIANTNAGTSYAVQFINDAVGNTIKYCSIQSANTSTTSGTIVFGTAAGLTTGNDGNTIDNCDITSGATNALNAIYSAGTSVALDNSGNTISNNTISNYFGAAAASNGIFVASNGSAWTITGNKFFQTATRTSTGGQFSRAIQIATASGGGYTINNNTIGFADAIGSGTTTYAGAFANRFSGIELTAANTPVSNIQGNTVAGISLSTTSGATSSPGIFSGIAVLGGSVNIGTTTANTIGSAATNGSIAITTSTSGAVAWGIYATSTGTVSVQNNTVAGINFTGTTAGTGVVLNAINTAGTGGIATVTNNTVGSALANSIALGTNGSTTATTTLAAIWNAATGTPTNVNSNTVLNTVNYSTGTSSNGYGIWNSAAGTGATVNLNSNVVRNNAMNTGTFYGINESASQSTTTVVNANANQVYSNTAVGTGTTTMYGIRSTTSNYTHNGNVIRDMSVTANAGSAVSIIYGIYNLASPTAETINNNQVYNLSVAGASTGTAVISGIHTNTAAGTRTVSGNIVRDFTFTNSSTGNATIYGIYSVNSSPNIFKNKIYGLTATNGASSVVYGINSLTGTTVNIYNNLIGNLSAPASSLTAPAPSVAGIYITSGGTVNVYNNTANITGSGGTNFGSAAIYVNTAATSVNLRNNIFSNTATPSGTGKAVAYQRSSTTLTSYAATSNNNLFYAGTPGANNLIYLDGTNADQTLGAFKTRMATRDVSSISEAPAFVSTTGSSANFLHIDTVTPTQIESGAATIALVTDDYDGDARNATTPDIGADEFAGTPAAVVVINNVSISPTGTQCTAVSRTVTANITAGASDITSVTLNYAFNGVAQTPITMTGGTLTAGSTSTFTAVIPVASPSNAVVAWNVSAIDAVTTKTTIGTSYSDEPAFGNTASATASISPVCPGSPSVLTAKLNTVENYANSFESGIAGFTGANASGTVALSQSSTYFSEGTKSMYLNTASISADVSASTNANINLAGLSSATLTFSHIASMEGVGTTAFDFGYVQYSADGGTTWSSFPTSSYAGSATLFNSVVSFSSKSYTDWVAAFTSSTTPTNALWKNETISIPAAALTSQFRLRFRYTTDSSTNYYGWLIDNVKISQTPATIASVSWSDGTNTVGTSVNLTVNPTATTTYTATVSVSGGCTLTTNGVTVSTDVTALAATVSPSSAAVCLGGSITLTANPTGGCVPYTYSWSDGSTVVGTGATLTVSPTVATTYTLTVTDHASSMTTATSAITVNNPQPVASGVAKCGPSASFTLNATPSVPGNGLAWYTASTGGTLLATGNSYVTPLLTAASTTYYVEESEGFITGLGNTTIPTGTGASAERGIVFTATSAFRLATAQYYSPTASVTNTVTVRLVNHTTGTEIATRTLPIVQGASAAWYTMNLNFDIVPGTYRLLASFSQPVNRMDSGASYPIALSTLGSITSGYDSGVTATSYNYFHNITVSQCTGSRVPVVATLQAPPALTLSGSSVNICPGATSAAVTLTSALANFDTYTWSPATGVSGDAVNGYVFNPTTTTSYTLTGTQSGGSQCFNTVTYTVNVVSPPTITSVTATPAAICAGDVSTLTATLPPVVVSTYGFAGTAGTYNEISGTATTAIGDDFGQGSLPIGFTFTYNGQPFTTFGASSNGFIEMGSTTTYINNTEAGWISSTNALASRANVIAPFWDDNNTTGGSVQYSTTGSAGSRVLTVQWTNMHVGGSGSATNPTISMQLKLYEGSNNIQFIYGATSAALSSPAASIGLSGAVGNYKSVTPAAVVSASTASSASENTSATATNLPSGTTYTFSMPATSTSVVWTPATDLYTDAAATLPYTGTSANTVYAKPNVTTTYTVTVTNSANCSSTQNVSVTLNNPTVADITGDSAVCLGEGNSLTLSNATPTGVWSSSDADVATVNSSGVVTPVAEGVVTISYAVTSNGCTTTETHEVTVNSPVVITSSTPTQTVVTGGNTTFTVAATGTGTPNLTYMWEVCTDGSGVNFEPVTNGGVYSGADTATLSLTNVPIEYHTYFYQCTVTGICNAVISDLAVLLVGETGIESHPSNSTICESVTDQASFTIVASPDVTAYQWQEDQGGDNWQNITDGGIYSGTDTATLSLSGVTAANTGWRYKCVVTGIGSAESNPATLTVVPSAVIDTPPTNQTVCYAGGSANFTVAATGAVSYGWQYSADNGDNWNTVTNNTPVGATYTGTASATLNVTTTAATPASGTYLYRAVANTAGSCPSTASASAQLVINNPVVTTAPAAASVAQGASASFSVVANTQFTATYQWQYATAAAGPWTDVVNNTPAGATYTGATSAALSVAVTAATSSGNTNYYRVVVSSGTGCSVNSASAQMTVTGYCQVPLTSTGDATDSVTNVIITNVTEATSFTQASAASAVAPWYTLYNNTPLNVTQGNNMSVAIKVGSDSTQYTAAWVDWNRNNTFEAGENVGLATSSAGTNATVTYTFTAPLNATPGLTRIRVRGGSDTAHTAAGACTSFAYGETEDYLLNIVERPDCAGTPVAGTITTPSSDVCVSGTVTFTATGNYIGSSGISLQWYNSQGPIASATGTTFTTPVLSAPETYFLRVTCANGGAFADTNSIAVNINNPSIVTTVPGTRCGTGTVALSATGSAGTTLKWYAAATGGAALATGNTFTTPSISATTNYFVEASSLGGVGVSGRVAPATSDTGSSFTNWGIVFDVTSPITLQSVDLYSTAAGTVNIKIMDAAMTTELFSTGNVNIANGGTTTPNVVPINFALPIGTGYRILVKAYSGVSLVRSSSSNAFPYNSESLNVTASEWGGTTTGTYYYMYNMRYSPASCNSARVQVAATVNTAPALTLSSASATICSGNAAPVVNVTSNIADYDSYAWTPSTGVSGTAATGFTFNPSVTTTYTLNASQTGGGQCVNATTYTVTVNQTPAAMTITPSSSVVCVTDAATQLSIVGATPAFTTITQNFNAATSFPSGWSSEVGSGDVVAVVAVGTTNAGGTGNEIKITGNSQTVIITDRVKFGPINTTGQSSLTLQWNNYMDWYSSTYPFSIKVQTSTDGITWHDTAWGTNPVTADIGPGLQTTVLNTADVGSSTLYIAFTVNGRTFGFNNWYIDNVTLSGNAIPITWAPTAGLYTDAAGTLAYAGGPATAVYAKPATTTTYTATATSAAGCTSTAMSTITVNQQYPFYVDVDGDGYGTGSPVNFCAVNANTPPAGHAVLGGDCNDAVAAIHPNAVEVPFNGVDDDCDGTIDETGTVTTTLLASSCGVTLASIQSLVGIQTVGGHPITGYRIRITNGSEVQMIEKIVPHFTFPQFPSYAYATTYTVDIQLQRAGIWQASWGAPCLVSTPAILEEGGAASVSPSQCGIVLPKINTLIATSSIAGVTGYRFRVTNLTDPLGPNAVQQIDRTQNWFSLQMLTRYNYGTTYRIEVAVKTTGTYGGFGAPCEVSSPPAPSLVNCGGTVASGTATVAAMSVTGATQYRFQITRDSDGAATTIDRSTNWFIFNSVPASAFSPGVLYNIRVAVMTTGTWSPFGDICQITSPGTAAKGTPSGVNQTASTEFRAVASPNPFTADFGIDVTTSSKENVQLQVYDMLGKLIESREVKLSELGMEKVGAQYPSGVYNVIVSQDGVVKTLRVIKR